MKTNLDFICLSYLNSDFLMEKSMISESLYFKDKTDFNLSQKVDLHDSSVELINFDYIVKNLLNEKGMSEENLVLKINNTYIETTAQAFVKNISLNEFKMFGSMMDNFFQKNGILAVRFLENKRIQYLLDANKFINTFKVKNK